jgi:hypothetical protein
MSTIVFAGMMRRMSAIACAAAVMGMLAVPLVSGASVASASVSEEPGINCALCEEVQTIVCSVLHVLPLQTLNESPTGFEPLDFLIETCASGVGTGNQ